MNILVDDAYERNLKNISLEVPIGQITGIIGPSGSGKSTLAHRVIGEYGG